MKKHTQGRTKASFSPEENERERKNRRVARQIAAESIVLLENDGTLPVHPGKIALYGSGALYTQKGGSGSGEVFERYSVSVKKGLENAGFSVTNEKWLSDYQEEYEKALGNHEKHIRRLLYKLDLAAFNEAFGTPFQYPSGRKITDADVKESDTDLCFYIVARRAGEGKDRTYEKQDFHLLDEEIEAIRFCAEKYSRFVVVLNTGACMDISPLERIEGINSVVYLCQQGCEGGNAFADIVTGQCTPSGHLTATWMRSYEDVPFGEEYGRLNGNVEEEYYKEGIYVGYRYFDSFQKQPKYPFGYGKSYTEFHVGFEQIEIESSKVSVYVNVKNVGEKYAGKEVVQIYLSCPQGKLDKPYQQLTAFAKTKALAPGETQKIRLQFDLRDSASYDEESSSFLLEKGEYIVRGGNSSRETFAWAALVLEEDVIVSRNKKIKRNRETVEELVNRNDVKEELSPEISRISIQPDEIGCVQYQYGKLPVCTDAQTKKILDKLTETDCVNLVVGDGLDLFSCQHYFNVPGGVGTTTSGLAEKGIPNIVMSDGPAGLRLQRTSTMTKKGKFKAVDMMSEMFEYIPGWLKKILLGNVKKETPVYQYTTAFPVSNAVAQTWNVECAYAEGKAVHEEMKEYGVSFWLAPGMNIHRNPLCGRNYEYYSEDPVLTGKIAAALTKGVQCEGNTFVTLKHFCCNNQEENRQSVSCNVSERTLREIYLRGFEIAVREGKAGGIMTSYNKVNGIYNANNYDLCTNVLRKEWGFDGIVMTDWLASSKGYVHSAGAIACGNDLLMPGLKSDKKLIKEAMKSGTLKSSDLRRCAANILAAIQKSKAIQRAGD